jgi:hypothetical protein
MCVLCILVVAFSLFASAQSSSKRKDSQPAVRAPQIAVPAAQPRNGAPSPLTTDTWTGGGGSNTDWSDASNWNNGAITSGENIAISTTTANTVDDQSYTIGTLTLSNAGDTMTLNNNVQTTVEGNITNNGTITFNAAGNNTGLFVNNSLTLSGSGAINLTSTNGSYTGLLYGTSAAVLTTSSTIEGAGTVGNTELNLVNSGTIDGNISGQTLLVNPDSCSGCTNTNTGTLEATNDGTLTLSNGTWTNTGGTIKATAGSTVNLQSNVTITGGTLTTSGTGTIVNVSGSNVFLNSLTNSGAYVIQNNGATEITGTITNNGTISIESTGNDTGLYLDGNATLAGTGTITLVNSSNQNNLIYGISAEVLTNETTIVGDGAIGNGELQITNASNGIINANVSGGNLILNPYTTTASSNAGTLEATGGGTLTLDNGTWTNTGTIQAQAGSAVNLEANVTINGGTLESSGTGAVNDLSGNDVFLNGVTLAGTYNIQNNAVTEINGTITNNGTINILSTGNNTGLYVDTVGTSSSATLKGTGTIVMSSAGGTTNLIYGVGGAILTIDQNISGVGNIGDGDLTMTNNSTIDANISPTVSTSILTIQPGSGGMTNDGTLEATNGGTLTLSGSTFTQGSGGVIEASGSDTHSNASTVILTADTTVSGGTLTTTGAGVIEVASGNTANLTNLTVSTGSVLNVINNGEISASGTITNNGTITLLAAGNTTYFYAPETTTLTGTGALVMSSTNGSYTGVVEAVATLTNDETIEGAGSIQDGTFVNNGTINANVSGQTLLLQSFTAATNTKTMEASNGGNLEFNGSSWTNTGGTITAETGASVELTANTTITGGTLSTAGTGQIYVASGNEANLSGLTISSGSALNVQNNGELNVTGTITNNGTITLEAAGNTTYFYAPSAATLTGSGTLVLSSTNGSYTGVVEAASTLTNDETIEGAGSIQDGTFTNNGTINANVSGQGLTLQTFSAATNTGTMEASNGGTLVFTGSTWTNTGGTIEALNGSSVTLQSGVSITGGTLTTSGTGAFNVTNAVGAYLTNLTNSGTINVENNAQMEVTGTITNNGTINVTSNGNDTYLLINGAVTLAGSGTIDLGGSCASCTFIYGEGTTPILTSDGTIEGAGLIGDGNMGFTNNGTVNANVAGQALTIDVNSSGFTNYSSTTNTLTGGNYIANGGNIDYNFGSATGITTLAAKVTEEGGGQFTNTFNSTNALANLTSITSTGSLTTDVNFTDAGNFSNAGSLTILGGTSFKVASLTQISGGSLTAGTFDLDSNLTLTGATETITTNATNLTLGGGTIENANGSNALGGLATNTGELTINNGAAVTTTAASFSNTGTLTVASGSTFTAPTLTQISAGKLTAGTWVLGGNIDLTTAGISITTNSATLTLEGGTINSNGVNALLDLATNTKSLTIADDYAYVNTVASFSNTGTLTIDSGSSFTATALTQYKTSTNTLSGGIFVVAGQLAFAAGANGIETLGSNLTLEGTGNIKNTTTGANSNALVNFNTISSAGQLTLADDANFTTLANFTNNGKMTIDAGSTFSVTGTLTNLSSGTLTGGTYTVDGTLQLASANGGITTNAATLILSGTSASIKDGSANALSGFDNNTGTFTLSSSAKLTTATTKNFTNSGTVDASAGTVLTIGGSTSTYTQTAGTTIVDGTLTDTTSSGVTVTGGTLEGKGNIKSNVTIGGSGTTPTINVGDAGKAGLLTITGNYTQLSTGTMNVSIGGTTVSTQYSQLKVTGTASLGGTLNVALINSFTPTVGQTFTILTAKSITGTFSNSYIVINSTEYFAISYTSTGVILTVDSGTPPTGNTKANGNAQASAKTQKPVLPGKIDRLANNRFVPPVWNSRSGEASGRFDNYSGNRPWDRIPVTSSWNNVATRVPVFVNPTNARSGLAHPVNTWRVPGSTNVGVHSTPVAPWSGVSRRLPKMSMPALPAVR